MTLVVFLSKVEIWKQLTLGSFSNWRRVRKFWLVGKKREFEIELSHNNIDKLQSTVFKYLDDVEEMDLSYNKIPWFSVAFSGKHQSRRFLVAFGAAYRMLYMNITPKRVPHYEYHT